MTEVSATVSCRSSKNHIQLKDTTAYFNLLSLSHTHTHTHKVQQFSTLGRTRDVTAGES
jgi:hypothetical protein